MKNWWKKQNWFVQTGIIALAWLTLFSSVAYPIYLADKKKHQEEKEQLEERIYELQLQTEE